MYLYFNKFGNMTIIEQEHIDPIKEELIKKIKEADSKYYKESPCIHCGPGNGCDDCRGCEDAKKNWELGEERRKAYNDFKSHFGYSYEQECDYKSIINAEKNYDEYVKLCQSCHGNFGMIADIVKNLIIVIKHCKN